jgi:hypothetical protein
MENKTLIKNLLHETERITQRIIENENYNPTDDCRYLLKKILECANKEERFDILFDVVTFKCSDTIAEIQSFIPGREEKSSDGRNGENV